MYKLKNIIEGKGYLLYTLLQIFIFLLLTEMVALLILHLGRSVVFTDRENCNFYVNVQLDLVVNIISENKADPELNVSWRLQIYIGLGLPGDSDGSIKIS